MFSYKKQKNEYIAVKKNLRLFYRIKISQYLDLYKNRNKFLRPTISKNLDVIVKKKKKRSYSDLAMENVYKY